MFSVVVTIIDRDRPLLSGDAISAPFARCMMA
jgi:hypothetical protein